MTELEERYRRWLAREQPSEVEASADFEATLAATRSRPGMGWAPAVALGAAAIALIVFLTRPSERPADPQWGVRFDLHVDGRPPETDVRIRIGERKDER